MEPHSAVRVVKPPPGVSNAKFRGRVGVVMYKLCEDEVVAIERRESERVQGLLAENLFEFVVIPSKDLQLVNETVEIPSWIATTKRKRKRDGSVAAKRVAVIVPFRDAHVEQKRAAQLAAFVPHMNSFLQGIDHRIFIVEQSNDDGLKFNRGQLLNVGYLLAKEDGCDTFVFHDVDLLPGDDLKEWYRLRPDRLPIHIARVWERYTDNPDYCGGIASWNSVDFECINGFPNNYWGWGGEDDEMMRRCKTVFGQRFKMDAPTHGTITDLEHMNLTEKVAFLKAHPQWKCNIRWELRDEHLTTWQTNGLRINENGDPFEFTILATEKKLGGVDTATKVTVLLSKSGDHTDQYAAE